MLNKDRKGKWQPFDALSGYKEELRHVDYEKNKIPKPVLSDDELEVLDLRIKEAIQENKEVSINYYHDGYIKTIEGIISKVDVIYKVIYIGSKKINFLNIMDIMFL